MLAAVLLLGGCRGGRYHRWEASAADQTPFAGYFNANQPSARYKAEVSIFGKSFSGIISFRFSNDTTCRAAFITMPGAKLFDMELTPHTDSVYSCLSQLSNPAVLRTIQYNIRTFVMVDDYQGEAQRLTDAAFKGIIWRRNTPDQVYHYYQPAGEPITRIELLDKKLKKKVELTAQDFRGSLPATVQIDGTYTLSIHLTQL
jgi:hypothetical protein